MNKFLSLFLVLIIGISNKILAQNLIIWQDVKKESYLFKYQNQPEQSQQVLNSIFLELASASKKPVSQMQLILKYEQTLRISRQHQTLYIDVEYKDFLVEGDLNYKGFPVNEDLVPDRIQFEYKLLNALNNPVQVLRLTPMAIVNNAVVGNYTYNDTSTTALYRFDSGNKRFFWDSEAQNRFAAKKQLVEYYYQADAQLKIISTDLMQINQENLDMLETYLLKLNESSAKIKEIEYSGIAEKLNLSSKDPVNLLYRMDKLNQDITFYKQNIQHTLSILHEIFFNKGLEALNRKQTNIARMFFEKSLQHNPQFLPSLLQLAILDFNENNINQSAQKLQNLFKEYPNIDLKTLEAAYALAAEIFNFRANEGYKLIKNRKCEEAVGELEKLKNYISTIYGFKPTINLTDTIAKAKRCFYESLLEDARQFYAAGNIDAAENLVYKALGYQKQNNSAIPQNNDAISMLKAIKNQRYLKTIENGKTEMAANNYVKAYDFFQTAKRIEKEFELNSNAELSQLIGQSCRMLIKEKILDVQFKAEKNELSAAVSIINECTRLSEQCGLNNDDEIIGLLQKAKNSVLSKECQNHQEAINQRITEAKKYCDIQQYIEAEKYLQLALGIAKEKSECFLNVQEAKDILSKTEPAIRYQKMWIDVINSLYNKDYEQTIAGFFKAEKYFFDNHLTEFKLMHPPFYDFVIEKYPQFIQYVVGYYIQKEELQKALNLLKVLKQRGYPRGAVKIEQKLLAQKIAQRDFKNNSDINVDNQINQYTSADKWFKFFIKEYRKQLKTLKK